MDLCVYMRIYKYKYVPDFHCLSYMAKAPLPYTHCMGGSNKLYHHVTVE